MATLSKWHKYLSGFTRREDKLSGRKSVGPKDDVDGGGRRVVRLWCANLMAGTTHIIMRCGFLLSSILGFGIWNLEFGTNKQPDWLAFCIH